MAGVRCRGGEKMQTTVLNNNNNNKKEVSVCGTPEAVERGKMILERLNEAKDISSFLSNLALI